MGSKYGNRITIVEIKIEIKPSILVPENRNFTNHSISSTFLRTHLFKKTRSNISKSYFVRIIVNSNTIIANESVIKTETIQFRKGLVLWNFFIESVEHLHISIKEVNNVVKFCTYGTKIFGTQFDKGFDFTLLFTHLFQEASCHSLN